MINTIEIRQQYCTKCGAKLLIREVDGGGHDSETGERLSEIRQTCPRYTEGMRRHNGFFGIFAGYEWHDHDDTEVFFIYPSKPADPAQEVGRLLKKLLGPIHL